MSTREEKALRNRLNAARVAIVALLGALEKVRDLITDGYLPEAKAYAESALLDADDYLELIDDPTNGAEGDPA